MVRAQASQSGATLCQEVWSELAFGAMLEHHGARLERPKLQFEQQNRHAVDSRKPAAAGHASAQLWPYPDHGLYGTWPAYATASRLMLTFAPDRCGKASPS